MTLLNPFSISLKKDPFMEVQGEPMHINGNFRIYRHYSNHFVHTFKNIVVAERCGANKTLLTNLLGETKPIDRASIYHDLERPKAAMMEGIAAAKYLNFKII